jgi:hypothetical protein
MSVRKEKEQQRMGEVVPFKPHTPCSVTATRLHNLGQCSRRGMAEAVEVTGKVLRIARELNHPTYEHNSFLVRHYLALIFKLSVISGDF